jgi:hypothetical protein
MQNKEHCRDNSSKNNSNFYERKSSICFRTNSNGELYALRLTLLHSREHSLVTRDAMHAPDLSGETKAPILIRDSPVPSVFISPSQETNLVEWECDKLI